MSKARDIASATLAPSGVTATELGYVDGVTSAIQTQINTKSNIADEFSAGKNKIINGDFGIWQRGTTFNSIANGAVSADRWKIGRDGTNTINVTQQTFTPGAAPVSGYEGQFFMRSSIASTGTLTFLQVSQCIEDVRTFAGQTVTVSFWAKGSATATGLIYGGQNFGSGGSSLVEFGFPDFSLTTSWQRFSVQLTVPSVSGKTIGTSSFLEIYFRGGLTANGSTFDIWGVQVEAGSTATPFQTATGTKQGELAACQRYYYRATATNIYSFFSNGTGAITTSVVDLGITPPVTMRVAPTSLDYGNAISVTDSIANYSSGTFTINANNSAQTFCAVRYTHGTAALTVYRPYAIQANNNAAAYIGWSAEL
jgi:hypothetical protein